jgi:hypothetical protein
MVCPSFLGDAELRHLTEQIMPADVTQPFGAYLFGSDEPGAELGRHVERTVFLEAFGNTPQLLSQEYDPYESSSVFLCIVDHLRRLPVGMMRVLMPSSCGFKSLNDIEAVWGEPAETLLRRTGLDLDPHRTWDIATLAIDRGYRGKAASGLVSMGLYQSLTLAARCSGVEWFVAILDMPVFRMLRWKLSLIFACFESAGPMPYLGSPASVPAWCHVGKAERRLAETDPDLHAILVEGVGLEPALRPVDLTRASHLAGRRDEVAAAL